MNRTYFMRAVALYGEDSAVHLAELYHVAKAQIDLWLLSIGEMR